MPEPMSPGATPGAGATPVHDRVLLIVIASSPAQLDDIITVILDLGNVLVFHDNSLLFRRLAARAGLPPAEAEQRLSGTGWTAANRGLLGAEGIRRDVCGALGVEIPAEEFNALWSSHFTVHEAVLPRVEGLVGRVKLVLLSNTNVLHAAWLRPRSLRSESCCPCIRAAAFHSV